MAAKMKNMNFKKFLKGNALTYLMVIVAYVILFVMQKLGLLSNSLSGFLVPMMPTVRFSETAMTM